MLMLDRWIEHPSSPSELVLTWRAPAYVSDRKRWAVGRLFLEGGIAKFRYYNDEELLKLNDKSRADLTSCGFSGYPAFDITKQPTGGFASGVLEAFSRRLPPSNRTDFSKFLEHHRFREDKKLSTMEMLALTEGRLPSDGFSLVDRLDPEASVIEAVLEVAGYRHYPQTHSSLSIGDDVNLIPDDLNKFDPQAVKLCVDGNTIGYVNRFQAETMRRWLSEKSVSAWLLRLNGQSGDPKAYIFVKVRPKQSFLAA
ncbi:hypothetical protein FKB34_12285 [Glycocaulis profundi]|nr:hypothetical protein FKB34_12285 [Glycocaulis profundi]